jgi:Protein of unknown function (DUF1569)
MIERRAFSLTELDQMMPEMDRLLVAGYEPAGNWSLGQTCKHLTETMAGSMEGFPAVPFPNRAVLAVLRPLLGRTLKAQLLKSGTMRAGMPLPKKFVPIPGLDDRAEAEALRAMARIYAGYSGPMAPHPMFGAMTRADWDRVHVIHTGHHLSFLVPSRSEAHVGV